MTFPTLAEMQAAVTTYAPSEFLVFGLLIVALIGAWLSTRPRRDDEDTIYAEPSLVVRDSHSPLVGGPARPLPGGPVAGRRAEPAAHSPAESPTRRLTVEQIAAKWVQDARAQRTQAWRSGDVSAIKAADAALAEAQEAARQIVGETQIVARGGVA